MRSKQVTSQLLATDAFNYILTRIFKRKIKCPPQCMHKSNIPAPYSTEGPLYRSRSGLLWDPAQPLLNVFQDPFHPAFRLRDRGWGPEADRGSVVWLPSFGHHPVKRVGRTAA